MNKVTYLIIFFLSSALSFCHAGAKIKIVASLSSYADIAKTIGGELVNVTYIASPMYDPHHITPRPSDIIKLKRADLFIHGGLDLEAWREPLMNAVGQSRKRKGGSRSLSLSQNVNILEVPNSSISRSEGDIHLGGNPHFWISPENGKVIARNIANKLIEIDRDNQNKYKNNLDIFTTQLDMVIERWSRKFSSYKELELIAYHNQWVYLTDFLGLKINIFIEPKPGLNPSTKHILALQKYVKSNKVYGIIQASFMPKNVSHKISKKTGLKVVLLCQNVGENSKAKDYLSMLEYNFEQLYAIFK